MMFHKSFDQKLEYIRSFPMLEREHIFRKVWLNVGRLEQIPNPSVSLDILPCLEGAESSGITRALTE